MQKMIRRKLTGVLALCLCFLVIAALVSQKRAAPVFARLPEATLIIDPGHGGEDGGAVSITGVPESGVNLAIALELDRLMGFYGVRTLLTRTEDVSIHDETAKSLREKKVSDLHNRAALINGTENATLISIHQNAGPTSRLHGAQVFYAGGASSLSLAETTQRNLRRYLDRDNTRVPQVVPSDVYLMNHIRCRAILVECGFVSNPEEDARLQTADYRKKLAILLGASYLTDQG